MFESRRDKEVALRPAGCSDVPMCQSVKTCKSNSLEKSQVKGVCGKRNELLEQNHILNKAVIMITFPVKINCFGLAWLPVFLQPASIWLSKNCSFHQFCMDITDNRLPLNKHKLKFFFFLREDIAEEWQKERSVQGMTMTDQQDEVSQGRANGCTVGPNWFHIVHMTFEPKWTQSHIMQRVIRVYLADRPYKTKTHPHLHRDTYADIYFPVELPSEWRALWCSVYFWGWWMETAEKPPLSSFLLWTIEGGMCYHWAGFLDSNFS